MDNKIFLFGVICIAALLTFGCTTQQKTHEVQPSEEVQAPAMPVQAITEVTPAAEEGPSVASARDGYGIAKDEAIKWKTDAKLIEVSGTNQKTTGDLYLPDGKTDTWIYSFVSIIYNEKYVLTVKNGDIVKSETFSVASANAVYGTAPDISAWKIDSPSAIGTANKNGGGDDYLINTPEPIANYVLKFEAGNPGKALWTVTYNPQRLGQSLIVRVSATTNTII